MAFAVSHVPIKAAGYCLEQVPPTPADGRGERVAAWALFLVRSQEGGKQRDAMPLKDGNQP